MTASAPPTDVRGIGDLRALADLRHRDPTAVRTRAEAAVAHLPGGHPARSTALWALGLALHELGEAAGAVDRFREAAAAAEAQADDHTAALARASMAISLLSLGDAEAAAEEIALADAVASPEARGLVELLRALVEQRTGRLDESLATYQSALRHLRSDGDTANVARLLLNRGTLLAYQGRFADALVDLAEAERLATDLDLWVLMAMAAHNLGFAMGRRGDVRAALAAFDRAEEAYAAQGDPPRLVAALAADRCEVHLSVGLARDAVTAARASLRLLGADGDATHHSEARLLLARALLASGSLEEARTTALDVARVLRAAKRGAWAAQAEYLALQAEILAIQDEEAPPAAGVLTRARRIAQLLDREGWPVEALHVRTFVARVALAQDRPELARTELSALGRVRHAPAQLRVDRWHATALLHLAEGDRGAAKRALRQGLRVVAEHRSVLGATELRAGATAHGAELARLGLRLAAADRRPWEVLRWAERWRAGSLQLPPVEPPDDPVLDAALVELRELRAAQRAAVLEGAPDAALDPRVTALEATVRARTMRGERGGDEATGALDPERLRGALGSSSLVELVAVDGRLLAVTVVEDVARLVDLAPLTTVADEHRFIRFELRRALAAPAHSADAERARAAVRATSQQLDDLLLAPLGLPPSGRVVVVPTGLLHGLPWGVLPSLAGRPVTVAPSAAVWSRRGRPARKATGRRTVLVCGPDLPGAESELDALERHYGAPLSLRASGATVAAVLEALERADLVHLAAHGTFRSDAPLFSSLQLADGPLTVYDLERVRSMPATVVLPACDAALSDVQAGDELLGTAAAMVGLGVTSVVAPVLPVPDDATSRLMLALHSGLRRGDGPSTALADAAREAGASHEGLVAGAFVCIGASEQVGGLATR